MNRKAQAGPLALILMFILFVILWALWLGSFIQEWGARMITDNGLTGVEAFAVANLNLWIFLGLLISIAWATYAGGGR